MVLQMVQAEQPSAVRANLPEPGPSDGQNLDDSAGGFSSDWTDLGTGHSHELHDLFGARDAGLEETLDPFLGRGVLETDVYNESVSAEPSLGRSSVLDINEVPKQVEHAAETIQVARQFDTQTALEVASRSIPPQTVEHVWEQGIWGAIFGDKSLLDVYKPYGESLKRPIDTSTTQESSEVALPSFSRLKTCSTSGLSYHDVVRDKPDISWQEQRDADLQSSVKFWMGLVNRWESSCSIVAETLNLGETDRVFMVFAHLFSGRSPVTVRKRGYSVMRLCDHLDKQQQTFPCSERAFYDFLCAEQLSLAPQSRMKGYMQSINFVRHVMAVDELEPLTNSARCKGACMGDVLRERLQASPLKVVELLRLHDLLYSCDDPWVRLFSGALLMCVYCRARWGDLMRTEHVILDSDNSGTLQFLEARTGRHKTMRAQMHRHQFLPMVAPCHGIDGKNWGSVWIQVRDSLHVAWPPEGLVMPAPGLQGQVTSRPLETQECAAWLRKLVLRTSSTSKTRAMSSKSLTQSRATIWIPVQPLVRRRDLR